MTGWQRLAMPLSQRFFYLIHLIVLIPNVKIEYPRNFTTKEVNMEYSIIFCLTIIAFMSYNINCDVCGNICTCEYEHPELEDN